MFEQKLTWLNPTRCVRTVVLMLTTLVSLSSCRETVSSGPSSSSVPIPEVTRLPKELADQVLAKVGDRVITLSDYALVLDRMDRIERLRYQTPERRRALLDEIINSELLAAEAVRRGLDKEPATLAYIDQLFRDELRRRLRAEIPAAESLPIEEVQAYYAQHRDEFRTPEMRRVAAIVLPNEALAFKLLAELGTKPSVTQWNSAAIRHSVESREPGLPVEVVGDLGLVTAPSEAVSKQGDAAQRGDAARDATRPDTSRVPVVVRTAAFRLQATSEVYSQPVKVDGTVYLIRLVAINPARLLSQEEAESEIRNRLVSQRLDAQYAALEQRLSENDNAQTTEGK